MYSDNDDGDKDTNDSNSDSDGDASEVFSVTSGFEDVRLSRHFVGLAWVAAVLAVGGGRVVVSCTNFCVRVSEQVTDRLGDVLDELCEPAGHDPDLDPLDDVNQVRVRARGRCVSVPPRPVFNDVIAACVARDRCLRTWS